MFWVYVFLSSSFQCNLFLPFIINFFGNIYYKGSIGNGTSTSNKNWQFSRINATKLLKQKLEICNDSNNTLIPFLLLIFYTVYVSLKNWESPLSSIVVDWIDWVEELEVDLLNGMILVSLMVANLV